MHNLIDKLPRLTLKFPFDASCNNSCTNNKHGEDDMKATCRTLCLLWLVLAAGMGWAKEQAKKPPKEQALEIISAAPQGNLNALDDAGAITITFNLPVIALSGVETDVKEGPLTLDPPASGTFRWMGTSTLNFIPAAPLAYGTRYVATVNAPIKAISGETMTKNYSFSFVTPRPQVADMFPYQEMDQTVLEQPIYLRFNQPVEPAALEKFITLSGEKGQKTPITIARPEKEDVEKSDVYWLEAGKDDQIKILPTAPLAMETWHALKLKAGLPGKGGALGMEQPFELKFKTYNHFRVDGVIPARDWECGGTYYPEYGVKVMFSNPVSLDKARAHLKISPEVAIEQDESYETTEYYLNPNFLPNTAYTLTLTAGLSDKYGNTLDKDQTFTFTTADFAPYLSMPSGRMLSEAYLGARFPVKIMNVYDAPMLMKAYRTPEDALKAAKMMGKYEFEITDPDVDRTYQPNILQNKVAMMPFDLGEVLNDDEETGIIGLKMGFAKCNGKMREYKSLIYLTNLSVTAKFSGVNNLFWVTLLKDSSPVADADIELYDENQQFLWKGKTDADGFAESPGWKELGVKATNAYDQPWIFALVRSGADQVIIHSKDGTGIWPYRFDIDYQENIEHQTNDGYIFTERGIYRPGEEVRVVGIIRDKKAGEFSIPQALKVETIVRDPDGKEVFKQELPVSEFGSVHFPLTLAQNAKIGAYAIECKFPMPAHLDLPKEEQEWFSRSVYGDFKVEMFRPVEFEVKVDLPQTEYIKGDAAAGKMLATYLFGGAVRNVPLDWNISRSAYWFNPESPDLKGFSFNLSDRNWGGSVAQQSVQLDDKGEYAFNYTLKDADPGAYAYTIEATVTDTNKRQVSNRQQVIAHGGEYYAGLKPASFFATVNSDFTVQTIAVAPNEKPLAGQNYTVRVSRVWWESVRRAGNGGRLYWESEQHSEVVKEFPVTSADAPQTLTLNLDKVGYYKVEADGADSRGNAIKSEDYFYAVGSGYAAWMRSDDDYVEIVPDAKKYQPGDTAHILVKSPYETVSALVTIEREGIIDRWIETVEGSADTIDVPIKPEYIPNAYVGVMLMQPRVAYDKIEDELDLGKPGFKIGYAELPVNPAERRLSVTAATDKEEYRPGEEVEIQLDVKDASGAGQEAEVVVSVVDVGVLNLIGYKTPDAFDYFYRSRPLGVLTSELRSDIVGQRNYSEKGERQGGGGLDMAEMMKLIQLREKFRPTAYHNPEVRTDANGRATVRFTLPDNLTAFKVMATAHTKNSLFGAGDKRFKVNKNLMLTPALPPFLRIGDTIQMGVLAHNRTQADGDAMVQTDVEGVDLTSADAQDIDIPREDKQEILFTYSAKEERDATFVFRGKMGEETDGVKVTIPVLLHRLPLTTALSGSTTENAHSETVVVPDDAMPGWGNVTVSLASTIFTDIKGGAAFLFGYPYGCLEQQISRILPIILAEDLIKSFNLTVFEGDDYRKVAQTTLDGFAEYQHESGGFGYWKKPYWPSPFVSAYAVFSLAMAKQAGYTVDADMEQKAVTYLQNVLKGQSERATTYRYNELAWNATDAFILYALSLYDKYEAAYATRLFNARGRMPVFGKTLLLKAVKRGKGDKLIISTLTKEILNAARMDARTAHFEESDDSGLAWIHHSNVRTTAAAAQAVMEVAGVTPATESFVPKAVEWLLLERKNQAAWRTTQENLFVFFALSTYLKTFEGTEPNFTGKVLLNGKEIVSELFKGRTTAIATKATPLDEFAQTPQNQVEFVKEGNGRMYYSATLTYLPSSEPQPIDYGIAVQKKMSVVKGQGIGAETFYRGDLVKIELTVTTPTDRLFVFVDDPLPAGFRALNFGLQTTDQSLREFIKGETPFVYSEYKDDRVVFFADYVEKGTHTVSYLVSAEHSGAFNLPPTFSAEMYTPEVFGQTGAAVVNVK